MSFKLGDECKIYRNTGSYGSPVWAEVENVRDVNYNLEHGEADLSTRANNGWDAIVATRKRGSFEWGMVYDTADADYAALEAAWFAKTAIDFAFVDGDIAVSGTKGIRATCQLFGFGQNQGLSEGVLVQVTAKPTYSANAPVQWTTA